MSRSRAVPILSALALGAAFVAGCSSSKTSTSSSTSASSSTTAAPSGTVVNVVVSDTSGLDGPETLTVDKASVAGGDDITFVVKNTGTIDHEMLVLKTSLAFDALPVVDCGDPPVACGGSDTADKTDEAGNIGETGDPNLKPGDTRTFTIKAADIPAGGYALVCNIAQHYQKGMRAAFKVT